MTADEMMALPAGRELDALVATKVLGWRPWSSPCVRPGEPPDCWLTGHEKSPTFLMGDFRPSADIAAAWLVVEGLGAGGWYWELGATPLGYRARFWQSDSDRWLHADREAEVDADTVPLAVCRAALLAVGAKQRKGPPPA